MKRRGWRMEDGEEGCWSKRDSWRLQKPDERSVFGVENRANPVSSGFFTFPIARYGKGKWSQKCTEGAKKGKFYRRERVCGLTSSFFFFSSKAFFFLVQFAGANFLWGS